MRALRDIFSAFALVLSLAGASQAFVVESAASWPCLVVIDPGHGGSDSGAVGPQGTEEKDIVLSVALKLARLVKEKGVCGALLTRSTDIFLPLEERTRLANAAGADMFLSIHANSSMNPFAAGVETFFLSFEATDEDAMRVAAFENSIAFSEKEAEFSGDIKEILLDMSETAAHHKSAVFAEAVHLNIVSATGRENRGVKQAPFAVLSGAAMPAALVEIGFISNLDEEKRLSSGKTQENIAESIFKGIAAFKKNGALKGAYLGGKKTSKKD